MLTKKQMGMVDTIFARMKDMLFAVGEVPQSYAITNGYKAVVFPMPLQVSSSVGMEIAQSFAEVEGSELVIFISEIWSVKRDAKDIDPKKITNENWESEARKVLGGKSPSQMEDKSESLMMIVLEVETKSIHMKIGQIKRDSEGGAYIDDDEWLPAGDLSNVRTSLMPTFNA